MKLADLIGRRVPRAACAGSLAKWTEMANMLFAPGCEAQSFALLCGFAAPLMSLFPTPEGGAVVSLCGPRKAGKTTALTAAATIWGQPQDYQLILGVGEAKFSRLAQLGNLPATCHTLTNHDPAYVWDFLRRMLVSQQPLPWQTILLSASMLSLVTVVREYGDSATVLELPLAAPKEIRREKDRMAETLIGNRGNAGHAFLQEVANARTVDWCRMQLISKFVGLQEQYSLSEAYRFRARAIAAAHVAGMIVSQVGILEFDPDRIASWAAAQAFGEPAAPPRT